MKHKNKVSLLGYYGSDEIIACSAWTSTSRNLTEEKRKRIPSMINQLWKSEPVPHKSPFEKGIVHFLVDTDIATHIHLLKHRIASINGESARYKELKEDKFYLPDDWKKVVVSNNNIRVNESYSENSWYGVLENISELTNNLYHECIKDLEPILGRKRAKETARFFKMYNSQIEADVMFNMSSFHNFLTQRKDKEHAQGEIFDVATEMLNLIKNIEGNPFEHTLKAWNF